MILHYRKDTNKKLTVLVSSTVYGIEELLDRIYTLLTQMGYEVWMSHKGTLPVFSDTSNVKNCIHAVEKCDVFLALITTRYGSGIVKSKGKAITHIELDKAIKLNKPRWILAHDHVVFARQLLRHIGYKTLEQREKLTLEDNDELCDLRIIDMYESCISSGTTYEEKVGDWVHTYASDDNALLFATSQFYRYQEVEAFIKEQFTNKEKLFEDILKRGEE